MIDSTRTGPARVRWAAMVMAMIVATLVGLVQPAGEASAQGVIGGANFTLISLATTANPGSRDVAFLWNVGTAQASYQLVRTATNASGNATIPVPNPVGVIGTQNFFVDSVPASAGAAACYRLVPLNSTGGALGSSDMLCIIFGTAQGTIATNTRVALNQTPNLNVAWDATAGAAAYIAWSVGTDGVVVTPGTTALLPGTGSLICGATLPVNSAGAIIGASNILCGVPGFAVGVGGTAATFTPTRTNTGTPPTNTPTRTATATNTLTGVPTNTNIPTNTIIPTNTLQSTATVTNTAVPSATVTNTSSPTITSTATSSPTVTGGLVAITKSSAPNPVNPGNVLVYTVTITNSNFADFQGTTFEDALPAGVQFISASPIGSNGFVCGFASGIVGCTGGTVKGTNAGAGNNTASVQIFVTVNNPCVVTSPIANIVTLFPQNNPPGPSAQNFTVVNGCAQATLTPSLTRTITQTPTQTSTNTPANTGTPTVTPTVTNTPAVDLRISKIDSPDPVTPGNTMTYFLVLENGGSASASGIAVIDQLENNAAFNCPSPTGGQCNTNNATNGANNVPTFVSASEVTANGFVCNFVPALNQVGCTGGQIGPNGGATIQIVVQTNPGCQFMLNRAVIDPTNTITESNENNNVAYAQTSCGATTATPLATLTPTVTLTGTATNTPTVTATATLIPFFFSKTDSPDPVTAGQSLTYTLTLSNTSSLSLSPIGLTDVLTPDVTYVSNSITYSSPNSSGITCGLAGTTFTCGDGTIASGDTATIQLVVLVNGTCGSAPASITNTANLTLAGSIQRTASTTTSVISCTPTATATNTPTVTTTGTATITPTASATPAFDLGITKTFPAPATRGAGDALNYTLTISNAGPATANNITVVDNSPAANYTISGTPTGTNGFTCVVNSGVVTCTGGSIAAAGSATITINGTVGAGACGTTLTNTATITTDNQNPGNDTAFANTSIVCADLDVTFTDNSTVFGPDNSASGNWLSTSAYTLTNQSAATGITGITFNVTETNAASAGTASTGNFVAAPAAGWTCASNGFNGNVQAFWVCNGSLAPLGTVTLDFAMDGVPGATASSTVNWDNTITCTTPGACTSGVVSPANSDGSLLNLNAANTPATDDPIVLTADLDLSPVNDTPAGEQLSVGTGPISSKVQYQLFNDRASPLTGVTFSGAISGTAARSSVTASINGGTGGTNAPTAWSCSAGTNSWSCSGDLTADTQAGSGSNTPNGADLGNFVTITLETLVIGPAATQTIVYTPNAAVCGGSPTPCTNNTVSPANADGGTTLYGPSTDALLP